MLINKLNSNLFLDDFVDMKPRKQGRHKHGSKHRRKINALENPSLVQKCHCQNYQKLKSQVQCQKPQNQKFLIQKLQFQKYHVNY